MGLLAGLVHSALVKMKVCRKMVKRYDVGAPSSITISLPGTDPQDAERRRQLALKALNERLKRVEDQSAWPSMDDEEDDDEDEVRTDTQPLLPGGRDPSSSTPRPAGGPVGSSLSSTSSSSMSQSSGGPPTGGAQHPESSIISFEDAPSRS